MKALYPSLDIPFAAKKIAEEFRQSKVNIERDSIDVYQLGLYLVLNYSEEELIDCCLKDYCPSRINVRGRKPNITGQVLASNEKKESMWHPPIQSHPDESIVKAMIAKALEAGINVVMRTHVYKFAGETRAQTKGGAIGLELTGEIAGVFMAWWDREMRKKMQEESVKVVVYKRYVDDINMIVEMCDDCEEEDVWRKIREAGNQIHESIQLEADFPSKHPDNKVPILDIKVWIENGKVLHEYYSKPVSSMAVIDAQSAMPLKDKRTVLTQDLLRVILRCSPELPWDVKKTHIDEYALRMQFSGYNEEFRKDVVRSAITAYEKIKRRVEKGERPLYRTKEWRKKDSHQQMLL